MESSRDSSVWRSLAVTFGGGLALGAMLFMPESAPISVRRRLRATPLPAQ